MLGPMQGGIACAGEKRTECLRRGLDYLEPSMTELGDGKNFC